MDSVGLDLAKAATLAIILTMLLLPIVEWFFSDGDE